jgi:hypothetical protein
LARSSVSPVHSLYKRNTSFITLSKSLVASERKNNT